MGKTIVMVEYGKTLSNAFKFSIDPKRWLPFLVLDAVAFLALLAYMIPNVFVLSDVIAAQQSGLMVASQIMGVIATVAIAFGIWSLVRLYIVGAMIHQSVKPKEYRKSCTVAKERYLSLLAVGVAVGLLSMVVGFVPYVGWLGSIIIGLMFFFAMPAAVAGKLGFSAALSDSLHLFREKLSDVFLAWLVIAVISSIIALIFMIPAFAIAWGALVPALVGLGENPTGTQILSILVSNGWSLAPAGLVFLVGIAITNVFGINAQTNFYLQLKKRKII
jgi:hypothetical protein